MAPMKGFSATKDPRSMTASQSQMLSTITKPKEFEVVDKIYKNEMEDIEKKLKEESPQKLKKLNQSVEQRIKMGAVELSGKLSRFEGLDKEAEKYVMQRSKEKLQSI